MKILITGSKGNLGTEIIQYCRHEIIGIHRDEWEQLDAILAQGVDVVIHAAYDLKNKIAELPTSIMSTNLLSTTLLLESMKKHGTRRLIFPSSCAVYGESMVTNEATICCPISVNGIVKLLNEKIIEEYCSKNGIKFEIYRVFNMFGGNDHFSILNHLKRALRENRVFQLNNHGISQRDFIHVEDVAKIIVKLLDCVHSHNYVNIGTGVSTRICEIVDIAKKKYPKLKIEQKSVREAEYSRADISRLMSLLKHDFIDVKKYVESEF